MTGDPGSRLEGCSNHPAGRVPTIPLMSYTGERARRIPAITPVAICVLPLGQENFCKGVRGVSVEMVYKEIFGSLAAGRTILN